MKSSQYLETSTQKLVPLQVPWSVTSATPQLRLIAEENGETRVTFAAYFLGDKGSGEPGSTLEKPMVVDRAEKDFYEPNNLCSNYQRVELRFKRSVAARLLPAFSSHQVVKEDNFDWSLPHRFSSQPGMELSEGLELEEESWITEGICPDPLAYKVESSWWAPEFKVDHAMFGHFLIIGEDSYVEVIGVDPIWRRLGKLEWG